MTHKALLIILVSLLVTSTVNGQVKYDRSSLTILSLEGENLQSRAITDQLHRIPLPDKFFQTPAKEQYINPGIRRINPLDYLQKMSNKTILDWFSQNKIPQQILSVWFNRQSDGTFNIDTLKKRGMYNASDNEFIMASSSKRGVAVLMDQGLNLVEQSYVLLFDFHNISSFEEFYNFNKIPKEDRDQEGFMANVKSYVLKLVFDEDIATEFFNDFWILPGDGKAVQKIEAFNNHKFKFEVVAINQASLQASQSTKRVLGIGSRKTDDDFYREIAQSALNMTLANLEVQVSDIQVRAMVSDVNPIGAKIGAKEDLKFENRYFVFENQLDKKGNTIAKRAGVVKAYKIIDNREVTSGSTEPSLFYQIAGEKIDKHGMYLVSRNNMGLNLSTDITVGGKEGFNARAEYFISQNMGRLLPNGRSGKLLTSISLYAELGFTDQSVSGIGNTKFSSLTFGLGKSIYPSRNFHLTPYGGVGFESATWDRLYGGSVSEPRVEYGIRAGYNLRHNVQLMVGLSDIKAFGQATGKDADGNSTGNYEGTVFNQRLGTALSFGIRLML
jgi:hypothetical protein